MKEHMILEKVSYFETRKQFPQQYKTQIEKNNSIKERSKDFPRYKTRNILEKQIAINQMRVSKNSRNPKNKIK